MVYNAILKMGNVMVIQSVMMKVMKTKRCVKVGNLLDTVGLCKHEEKPYLKINTIGCLICR